MDDSVQLLLRGPPTIFLPPAKSTSKISIKARRLTSLQPVLLTGDHEAEGRFAQARNRHTDVVYWQGLARSESLTPSSHIFIFNEKMIHYGRNERTNANGGRGCVGYRVQTEVRGKQHVVSALC